MVLDVVVPILRSVAFAHSACSLPLPSLGACPLCMRVPQSCIVLTPASPHTRPRPPARCPLPTGGRPSRFTRTRRARAGTCLRCVQCWTQRLARCKGRDRGACSRGRQVRPSTLPPPRRCRPPAAFRSPRESACGLGRWRSARFAVHPLLPTRPTPAPSVLIPTHPPPSPPPPPAGPSPPPLRACPPPPCSRARGDPLPSAVPRAVQLVPLAGQGCSAGRRAHPGCGHRCGDDASSGSGGWRGRRRRGRAAVTSARWGVTRGWERGGGVWEGRTNNGSGVGGGGAHM